MATSAFTDDDYDFCEFASASRSDAVPASHKENGTVTTLSTPGVEAPSERHFPVDVSKPLEAESQCVEAVKGVSTNPVINCPAVKNTLVSTLSTPGVEAPSERHLPVNESKPLENSEAKSQSVESVKGASTNPVTNCTALTNTLVSTRGVEAAESHRPVGETESLETSEAESQASFCSKRPASSGPNLIPSHEELEAASRALQTVGTSSGSTSAAQALALSRPNNAVAYCLDLFQRNSDVQAAVMSLARDPDVWNAFLNNEKVQEFVKGNSGRRLLMEGNTLRFQHHSRSSNPFVVAFYCLIRTLVGVLDSLVEVVHGVFGFVDRKLFGGSESDPTDQPVKACMVLTILLLSLILLAR